jgi:hypothetical protein
MNRNGQPYHLARRAPPPLSIPVPPRPMHPPPVAMKPPFAWTQRKPCGFCARVRKVLGLGP